MWQLELLLIVTEDLMRLSKLVSVLKALMVNTTTSLLGGIDLHGLLTHLDLLLDECLVIFVFLWLLRSARTVSVALETILGLELDARILLNDLAILIIQSVVDGLFALAMLFGSTRGAAFLALFDDAIIDEVGHLQSTESAHGLSELTSSASSLSKSESSSSSDWSLFILEPAFYEPKIISSFAINSKSNAILYLPFSGSASLCASGVRCRPSLRSRLREATRQQPLA